MDTLTRLAIKYKTDKWGKHHYTPVYYDLFKNKNKRKSVKKVLEIGVAEGAGVRMFRDFFTHATIYGAEIDRKRLIQEDRIITMYCDQSNQNDLASVIDVTGIDVDFIVDDGSHKPKDQVFTALNLLSVIKQGCIYVIEDVYDTEVYKQISKYFKAEIKRVGERYDDQLIIIRK